MKKMKLSEAILKGCKKTEPGKNYFFRKTKTELKACALGAAYFGLFGDKAPGRTVISRLSKAYPFLQNETRDTTGQYFRTLGDRITYLNDSYGWSRERIAKWVAKLEKKLEAK